jgi:N,N'-diacetyllegionaminate synthase
MNSVYIIAEAGVNHNGDLEIARKMIDIAAMAEANAIKFQTFKAENLVSIHAEKAEYQKKLSDKEESQFDMIKKLELDIHAHEVLISYSKQKNIDFLSAPFDLESIDLLSHLGLSTFKIPSGEITNLPYLRKIGRLNKTIILSTGMCNLSDIEFALNTLVENGTDLNNITVLHCNTEYPTPYKDVNLKAMLTIKDAFKVSVGYSDHSLGIDVPIAAVALGARVIEKHFTLSKDMIGPDHKASLNPDELVQMVKALRNIEVALGDGIKKPTPSEMRNMSIARKSIVASSFIKKGDFFTIQNVTVKRPGTGISPLLYDYVLGKIATKDYTKDDLIDLG